MTSSHIERSESLTHIPAPTASSELRRRVIYLMLFRLVLISLVLGLTLLIWWFTGGDEGGSSSLWIFAVIGATYLLTLLYALAIRAGMDSVRLGEVQLGGDLVLTAFLVYVTGGAQSAYTFLFPLSIIGAASIKFRTGAVMATAASAVLFLTVSLLGWSGILPTPVTHGVSATDLSVVQLVRAVGLNLAAFAGVGFLAVNMGQQIQQTIASLESEREAAADLFTLHEDIVRCLSSGLITVDERQRVLAINQAACDLLHTIPARAIGRPVDTVVPGLSDKLAKLPSRSSLRRGDMVTEIGHQKLVLGLSISPLRDNQDRVIGRVLNFTDLTELRKMEKQVKHAERMAAIGTLAAGVAHEIRNPLASISGSIELLRSSPDEDNGPLMDIIVREIDRLNVMITDLLNYTNPGPREVVELDFGALVTETVRVFGQDPAVAGIEISMDEPTDELGIMGDPGKLKQVIWNLLRNAAEAAAAGGGHVTVELTRDGEYAVLEVRDDGPGMDEDQISQVFDPFFTTKQGGSGLGLATSHNIITEHAGQIRAETSDGGARFVVRLPMETTGSLAQWRKQASLTSYTAYSEEENRDE